jgi:GH15 family glucan-1,4-alpha-glucosidase
VTRLVDRLVEHGAVGDGASTALVASNGSIDWWAPGGVATAPSCFSLVDARSGGEVRLGPTRPDWTGAQSCVSDEAPILTTTFDTPDGSFEVVDHLHDGRIVRILTVLRGTADVVLAVRPGHAFGPPRKVERWSTGIAFGDVRIEGTEPDVAQALRSGDRIVVTVSAANERGVTRQRVEQAHPTIGEALAEQQLVRGRWRSDVGSVEFDSALRPAVLRSVRALRLLVISTSSDACLLRALTTSLPARTGNERNIDERFAWLRDNAHAVRVFSRLQRMDWAGEHRQWLHERAADALPLSPAYQAVGERPGSLEETAHAGWLGNSPVRTGSFVGSLVDLGAVAELSLELDDRHSWKRLEKLGDWLADQCSLPDAGRWDSRAKPRRHVESALAVRAALVALVATARRRNPVDPVTESWTQAVSTLDIWLATEGLFGVDASAGFRRTGGAIAERADRGSPPTGADDSSDASLLRWISPDGLPTLREDFVDEAHHRARVTLDQSVAQLTEWPYAHRHLPHVDDGFPPGQGADLWASFTMVSALARFERWEEAHERMEGLLRALGPTHIGSTHIDPMTGDLRGNLLAAPTHLALIDAACDLARGPR